MASLSAVVHIVGWHGVVVPEALAKRLKSGRASCRKHEAGIVEGKHYVKQFVDLRRIGSTLVCVQIENTLFWSTSQNFACKVAETKEEVKQSIEAGFEYVMQKGTLAYFRKRK